jgi:plastocyanin
MPVLRVATALAAVAGLLAACSSTPSTSRPEGSATASLVSGVQQVTIHSTDDNRFRPATITVHPGRVELILVNDGKGAPHNWQVPDFPADFVPLTSAGQTREATFTAPAPGTYSFVCTLHEKQGMIGTLVVLSH